MPRRIAIATDFNQWHEAQLRDAFQRRGSAVEFFSLSECGVRDNRLYLPQPAQAADGTLPAAVLVRFVPGGSFEAVTLRLAVLHALTASGVMVCNSARVIERTVDKATTSFLLAKAGVPTPPAWACGSIEAARAIAERQLYAGEELVLKPLFGAQARGLIRISTVGDLPPGCDVNGIYYLQKFIARADSEYRDWRVLVVGERAVAAMERRSTHWVTNRARGATCHPVDSQPELFSLAERACQAVGADYAGVDIVRDANGDPWVLEVNGVPAWRGVQSVTSENIAEQLAALVLARCQC